MPTAITSHRTGLRPEDASLDLAADEFGRLRARLLGIARRITGSHAEAEDVVQDAWLRWQTYDRTRVQSSTAFLVTTTTRLAINASQSARMRRECPVGDWTQEAADLTGDPATEAERRDDLERGLRLLHQRLSSTERIAFVLRQAYAWPYPEIAERLSVTEAHARQHVSRAGRHLSIDRPRLGRRSVPSSCPTLTLACA